MHRPGYVFYYPYDGGLTALDLGNPGKFSRDVRRQRISKRKLVPPPHTGIGGDTARLRKRGAGEMNAVKCCLSLMVRLRPCVDAGYGKPFVAQYGLDKTAAEQAACEISGAAPKDYLKSVSYGGYTKSQGRAPLCLLLF